MFYCVILIERVSLNDVVVKLHYTLAALHLRGSYSVQSNIFSRPAYVFHTSHHLLLTAARC